MPTVDDMLVYVPSIKLDGTDIPQRTIDHLVHVRVSRSSGKVSHAELRFDNTSLELDGAFTVGGEIQIGAEDGTASTVLFKGAVTSIGVELSAAGTLLVVEALDASRKLGNTIALSSSLNVTASDIVREIAQSAQLSVRVDSTSETFDHVQQYGTPLQFLDMLVARYGYEWRVDEAELIVYKRETGTAVTLSAGIDLIRFTGRVATTGLPKEVRVRGWNPAQKESITATALVADNESASSTIAGSGGAISSDGTAVVTVQRPSVTSMSEAQSIADGLAARIASMHVTGRGEAMIRPDLRPGVEVELRGLGDQWNGKYYINSVEHVFGADRSFTTRFTIGSIDPGGLASILAGSAAPTAGVQLGTGISVGIVTNIDDPDGLGRVKVKLPNIADDNESWWARVVSPGAGSGRGSMSIPEVDDEVAVAFENGDLQRPYVLGGLWNGVTALPGHHDVVVSGKVASRSLTSRGGSYIALYDSDSDSAGSRYIEVKTSDGKSTAYIGEDNIKIHADGLPVTVSNDKSSVEIADNGNVTLTAGGNVVIDAGTKNITIKGNNIELTATGSLKTSSTNSTEIKGSAGVKVDGSPALTEIKGSMVKLN